MKFNYLASALLTISGSFLLVVGDSHVDRINAYLEANTGLTTVQREVLYKAISAATSHDQTEAASLLKDAEAAFGKVEAIFLLTGKVAGSDETKRSLSKRKPDCDCTDDWECSPDKCQAKDGKSCWKISNNCGVLGLFDCNGLCGR
jgi:hypothetical protein